MIADEKITPEAILFVSDIAAINILANATQRRSLIDDLRNILVEREPGVGLLSLFATDLEVGIEYHTQSAGDAFHLSLDARTFVAGVTGLRATALQAAKNGAYLHNDGADFFVPGAFTDGEAFRVFQAREQMTTTARALSGSLFEATHEVAPSASHDKARGEVLGSVCFEFHETFVRVVATDGYQLATTTFGAQVEPQAVGRKDLVPARVFEHLQRIREEVLLADTCTISTSPGRLRFALGQYVLTAKTVDGTYPNWKEQPIFPKPLDWVFVNREALVATLQRAERSAEPRAHSILLSVENGTLTIANTAESGTSRFWLNVTHDELNAKPRVALNARYVSELVSRFGGDNIALGFSGDSLKPVLFREADSLDEARAEGLSESLQAALMPLRWSWE